MLLAARLEAKAITFISITDTNVYILSIAARLEAIDQKRIHNVGITKGGMV